MLDAMVILIATALALFSVVILAYPLFRSRSSSQPQLPAADEDGGPPDLESIYGNISTLRLEYQLGDVSESLYREQLTSYRIQAAAALRHSIEAGIGDTDQLLEQEVLVARVTLDGTDDKTGTCPSCGEDLDYDSGVCPRCAPELRELP